MGMISTMLTCSSHPADVMLAYEKLKANKVPITMSKSGEFWLWNEQAKFCQRVWETDIKTMAETK